jgi:hypothetical protein
LLTLYQLLRTAMVEAIETRPGLDPDRASFTTALLTAHDQLITAQGIDPHPATASAVDRLGMIGHAVLATLLPARRLRYSNRNVKCTTSRYHARDDGRPALSTDIIAIDIAVRTPPLQPIPVWLLAEQTGLRRLLGRVRFSGLEGSIRGGEPGREAGVRDRWDERRSGLH